MKGSLYQIDECWYGTTLIQQRIHLYIAFVMMQTSPWAKLKAQLDSGSIKGVLIPSTSRWKAILVKFSCPSNKNLPGIMVYTPILGLIDMGQSGTLDILYSDWIEFGRECNQRCSVLRRLIWELNCVKLITINRSLHLNSMACLLPLYLFTHLSNSYLGMSDMIWANTVFPWFMISVSCNTICKSTKSNLEKIKFV